MTTLLWHNMTWQEIGHHIAAGTNDHDGANGQYEFDFHHADAVTACDRYTFLRLANRTGNRAHFNMSLSNTDTGTNLFKCDPKDDPRGLGLTEIGYKFIGGIIKHGKATLTEAVDEFEIAPFIIEALGQELRDEFITYKCKEWNTFHQTITPWEVERYDHLF